MKKDPEIPFETKSRLSILKNIAEALNETIDVGAAMTAILPHLSSVLGLSTAWAFRYDPVRQSFVEVGASGLPKALSVNHAAPLKCGWCECQEQFVKGDLLTAVNIVRCSRLRDAIGDKNGLVYHASIPLRSKDKPLGILNVAASGHHVFTEDALELLTTIGNHVAVAFDRAGILSDERQRVAQLQALSEMSPELLSVLEPTQILQVAVLRFVESMGYEACGVTLSSPRIGSMQTQVVTSAHRTRLQEEMEYSYASKEDFSLLPENECLLLEKPKSFLVQRIPHSEYDLRLESSNTNAFSKSDQDLLSAFAWYIATAIENARLYKESMTNARWLERRHLAAELHDSVSQRLFSALLLSQTASVMMDNKHPDRDIKETILKIQSLIHQSQEEMRDLIHALRPKNERGFSHRVRELIARMQLQSGTRVEFEENEAPEPLIGFDVREALLKVVNEALQNVLKHAKARHASIHLIKDKEALQIIVHDDGIGFVESSVKPGLGTTTMYDRMYQLSGTLHIHSAPGQGTTVNIILPVHERNSP